MFRGWLWCFPIRVWFRTTRYSTRIGAPNNITAECYCRWQVGETRSLTIGWCSFPQLWFQLCKLFRHWVAANWAVLRGWLWGLSDIVWFQAMRHDLRNGASFWCQSDACCGHLWQAFWYPRARFVHRVVFLHWKKVHEVPSHPLLRNALQDEETETLQWDKNRENVLQSEAATSEHEQTGNPGEAEKAGDEDGAFQSCHVSLSAVGSSLNLVLREHPEGTEELFQHECVDEKVDSEDDGDWREERNFEGKSVNSTPAWATNANMGVLWKIEEEWKRKDDGESKSRKLSFSGNENIADVPVQVPATIGTEIVNLHVECLQWHVGIWLITFDWSHQSNENDNCRQSCWKNESLR